MSIKSIQSTTSTDSYDCNIIIKDKNYNEFKDKNTGVWFEIENILNNMENLFLNKI